MSPLLPSELATARCLRNHLCLLPYHPTHCRFASFALSDNAGAADAAMAALASTTEHPLLELMTALTDFTRRSAGLVGSLVACGLVLFLLQRLLRGATVRSPRVLRVSLRLDVGRR